MGEIACINTDSSLISFKVNSPRNLMDERDPKIIVIIRANPTFINAKKFCQVMNGST